MIEILQHFLLQKSTTLHITLYKYFWDSGLQFSFRILFFVHTRTYLTLHMHAHAYPPYTYIRILCLCISPLYLHARTHYSDAHTTCEKVPLRLFPKSHQNSSQSTLVLFTPPAPCFCSFRLLFYAIQNSSLPISPFKFSIPGLPEICRHLSTERKTLP